MVPSKPAIPTKNAAHALWGIGTKGIIPATEGLGIPGVMKSDGTLAAPTFTDGTVPGTTDPTWTQEPLSNPTSPAVHFDHTSREILAPAGTSLGIGLTIGATWHAWATFRWSGVDNEFFTFVNFAPSNANAVRLMIGNSGNIIAQIWNTSRSSNIFLTQFHAYSLLMTLAHTATNTQVLKFYVFSHSTMTEYPVATVNLAHGNISQTDESPKVGSRQANPAGRLVDLYDVGWASQAGGTALGLTEFRAYYGDPSAHYRATPADPLPTPNWWHWITGGGYHGSGV